MKILALAQCTASQCPSQGAHLKGPWVGHCTTVQHTYLHSTPLCSSIVLPFGAVHHPPSLTLASFSNNTTTSSCSCTNTNTCSRISCNATNTTTCITSSNTACNTSNNYYSKHLVYCLQALLARQPACQQSEALQASYTKGMHIAASTTLLCTSLHELLCSTLQLLASKLLLQACMQSTKGALAASTYHHLLVQAKQHFVLACLARTRWTCNIACYCLQCKALRALACKASTSSQHPSLS